MACLWRYSQRTSHRYLKSYHGDFKLHGSFWGSSLSLIVLCKKGILFFSFSTSKKGGTLKHTFFVCRTIFLRHGNSEYTEVYPDLTTEGRNIVLKSGEMIKKQIDGWNGDVNIVTSPTIRAIASANIIKNSLNGTCNSCIEVDRRIRAMEVIDKKKSDDFFENLPKEYREFKNGARKIDREYNSNPIWERGDIFEKRSDIQERFVWYLRDFVKSNRREMPPCVIHISHLEVLWSLFDEFYAPNYEHEQPFSFGEFFILDFYGTERPDLFSVKTWFRGREASGMFNGVLRKM